MDLEKVKNTVFDLCTVMYNREVCSLKEVASVMISFITTGSQCFDDDRLYWDLIKQGIEKVSAELEEKGHDGEKSIRLVPFVSDTDLVTIVKGISKND